MRTDASRTNATQSIVETNSAPAETVDASQADLYIDHQATQDDGLTLDPPDSTTAVLAAAPSLSTPASRPALRPGNAIRWVVNVTQGLSLDERLGRILLSLVLAALLWFYVTSLENPAQVTQFNSLSLEVRDLPSNVKVINALPTVGVSVQASQSIMNSLREADIKPYIDLNLLGAGVHEVPVGVDVNGLADRNAINLSVVPRSVQVQLEIQATRVYTVAANIVGAPAFGYSVEPPQVEPSQVKITGSESDINRIAQVLVTVDIEQRAATQRGFKNPVALDASGQEVTGLTFEPATVQVVVPIKLLLNYKLVPVHVPVVGNPAPGYSAFEIKLDPTNVTICCAANEILEPVLQLETEPVSITGTTSTVVTTTRLILPTGVELYPGQSPEISVTVRIDTFETSWQLSIAPTVDGLAPGTSYVISPKTLDLTLSGTLAQFQNLNPADITASVDVQGLGPGTYELDPQVNVPSDVKLTAVSPAKLTVSLIPPTPVPPTPTEVPTPEPTATHVAVVPSDKTPTASPTHTSLPPPTLSPMPTASPTPPLVATPTHTQTPTPTLGTTVEELPTAASAPTPAP
jgi:YbbR domain-containing protein